MLMMLPPLLLRAIFRCCLMLSLLILHACADGASLRQLLPMLTLMICFCQRHYFSPPALLCHDAAFDAMMLLMLPLRHVTQDMLPLMPPC